MSDYFVHETAVVDAEVTIGARTKVWHFCHLMPHTVIGSDCVFGQNCSVGPTVKIGDRVKVQNNVSIYRGVEIASDVFLGPSMVFTNVINPRAFIERKDQFRPTYVARGASIGANATILCGVTIGEYALIGAGTVVTRDVPAHALVYGVPGRVAGYVSVAGQHLDFGAGDCATCPEDGSRYRLCSGSIERLR